MEILAGFCFRGEHRTCRMRWRTIWIESVSNDGLPDHPIKLEDSEVPTPVLTDWPPSGRGADYELAQRLAVSLIVERGQRMLVRNIMARNGVRYLAELPRDRLPQAIQMLQDAIATRGWVDGETFDVCVPLEQRPDD